MAARISRAPPEALTRTTVRTPVAVAICVLPVPGSPTSTRTTVTTPLAQSQTSRLLMWEPNGILYEIATGGPDFAADERVETLGACLVLPPFLEGRRTDIERGLKSI